MRPALYLLFALASARSAFSLAWPGPSPTESSEPSPGWDPKPTANPHEKAVVPLNRLLAPRAVGDNVCGYINGQPNGKVTCPGSDVTCAPDTELGALGCCSGGLCSDIQTACIASFEYSSFCSGISSCEDDTYTLKCTYSTAPYCIRWTYGGYSAFGCSFSPTVEMLSMSSLPTSTGLYVTTTETATVTEAPTGTGTTLAGTDNGQPTCRNRTPVGAIVGGVVGAFAVLVAAVLVLMLLLDRGKKQPQPQPQPMVFAGVGKSDGQYPPQPGYVPQPPAPVMSVGELPQGY